MPTLSNPTLSVTLSLPEPWQLDGPEQGGPVRTLLLQGEGRSRWSPSS